MNQHTYDEGSHGNLSIYDIWLDRVPGLSAAAKGRLAEQYGNAAAVYEAGAAEICYAATGKTIGEHPKGNLWRSMFRQETSDAEEQLKTMEKKEIHAVSRHCTDYPQMLRFIADPPWILYYRGHSRSWNKAGIAVVGARKSTEYGRWAAFELGRKLGKAGVTVVSGMAYGVDAEAHKGALEGAQSHVAAMSGDGSTIAVFGCGVDICYPRSNAALMEEIIERGAVVSEFLPGTEPRPFLFPRRNRIISGMSSGVVVVEAGLQSGSLITAELAAEQGREVYAVPGNINRPASIGTNKLIRDGAVPIVVLDDILIELGFNPSDFTESIQNQLGNDERAIYNEVLYNGEMRADQLALRLSISVGKVNAIVTIMEMKGLLQTALGKIFIAKS